MSKARVLLDEVITLIERDLSHIKNMSGKLDSETSMDLARYSSALLAITKDKDAEKDEAKKNMQKLSNKELIRLAQEAARELDVREDE